MHHVVVWPSFTTFTLTRSFSPILLSCVHVCVSPDIGLSVLIRVIEMIGVCVPLRQALLMAWSV